MVQSNPFLFESCLTDTRGAHCPSTHQDKDNINGMHHLALEATAINQNFSQQVGGSAMELLRACATARGRSLD